jgi:uncharacterized membrane protein
VSEHVSHVFSALVLLPFLLFLSNEFLHCATTTGMHTGRYDFWFLVVSGVMVALVWAQLFWAMYFFDLLALYEAYHDHPSGFAENKVSEGAH